MARRKKNKSRSKSSREYLTLPELSLDDRARRSIWIVLLLVLGAVSFLGLFNLSGNFGEFLSKWLAVIFGFGKVLIPFVLFYWASLIIRKERHDFRFNNYLGLFFIFIS